jgi:hypothetical protein
MNEGGVSDPKAHKEAVMKRCKLMSVTMKVGDAAMIYIKSAGNRPCLLVGPVIKP